MTPHMTMNAEEMADELAMRMRIVPIGATRQARWRSLLGISLNAD
jgi:hypothetical protein